jgi:Na+/proline symporter
MFSAVKKATIIVGIIGLAFALLMATWDIKSLWDEFSKILGILLGGLGGLFLLGFLCKRANSAGAIAGLVASMLVQVVIINTQAVNLLLYSTVGFITCFIVGYLVSLFTGGPKKKIEL